MARASANTRVERLTARIAPVRMPIVRLHTSSAALPCLARRGRGARSHCFASRIRLLSGPGLYSNLEEIPASPPMPSAAWRRTRRLHGFSCDDAVVRSRERPGKDGMDR